MPLEVFADGTFEPVSKAEAKAHLRVDHDADDFLIDALAAAARQYAEDLTGRGLVRRTYDLFLDAFPRWTVELPRPPVDSVTTVKYLDTAGAQQTLAASKYVVDAKSSPGRVTPAWGESWPATRAQVNAVEIRFVAGHANATVVSPKVKLGIKLLISTWYDNRDSLVIGASVAEMPKVASADLILLQERVWSF